MIKNDRAAQHHSQGNHLGASKEKPESSHKCNFKLPLEMNYRPHDLLHHVYGQKGCKHGVEESQPDFSALVFHRRIMAR